VEPADKAVQALRASWNAEGGARRFEMDVEMIFADVDPDEDGVWFVHDPTLRMRAQAQAAVRVRDCGMGAAPSSVPGLQAQGGRGLTPTIRLAGFAPAGNSKIQGGPSRNPS
jgi:hypothetical protein